MGTIYLLHFSSPYKHARHYMGYSESLACRLARHREGNGSRLVEVIQEAGLTFSLARIWTNSNRTFERKLKNYKNSPQLCPVCQLTNFKRGPRQ